MTPDDEEAGNESGGGDGPGGVEDKPDGEGEEQGAADGAERDVAAVGNYGDEEDGDGGEGQGGEVSERAGEAGDGLTTFELHKGGEGVTEEDGEGREGKHQGAAFAEVVSQPNGEEAFADVEQEREQASGAAGGAEDVGGADVAAAHGGDVLAGFPADDPGAEGEAAEEEAQDEEADVESSQRGNSPITW